MTALADTSFLLVGAGGLGTPLALALQAVGVGRLVIVDDDVVEISNPQRQILYRTADVGRSKAEAAGEALAARGGATRVETVRVRFDRAGADALVREVDVVCDGSDNLETKFLVNDAALAAGRPFVVAAVLRASGQVFPVRPGVDACYRCLFEAPPEGEVATCADAGVLGATCGEVAALQARCAAALATGHDPDALLGRLWLLEPEGRRPVTLQRRRGCCLELAA